MSVILEGYQIRAVNELSDVFANVVRGVKGAPKAAVLKAPTASGKTIMLARTLSMISESGVPTVTVWLAPFDNIVVQTERTIRSEAAQSLRPKHLRDRTWDGHRAGDVWISTASLASSSNAGPAEDTEFSPSLRSMAAEIRKAGLRICVVIDEAHLNAKQKGKFIEAIQMIDPDVIYAATATPRDEALDKFFAGLGLTSSVSVVVDRDEAVQRHLNKQGIWARMVSVRGAGPQALLEGMVRATWRQNEVVQAALDEADIDITALCLFQAQNKEEGDRLYETVLRVTGLTPNEVALYDSESKNKSQKTLGQIADDPQIRVLIFKVAAGTGFDAPRAFCLGSARTVRDEVSAAQFIGRIMRVPRALRAFLFANPNHPLAAVLNNAHLFLVDDEAQTGFQAAVMKVTGSFAAAGVGQIRVDHADENGDIIAPIGQAEMDEIYARVLARAGEDGAGYADLESFEDDLANTNLNVHTPRHEDFKAPLSRQEWRLDDLIGDVDVLEKLRGVGVTPQRVRDRLERAHGLLNVSARGDDLNTAEDEDDVQVSRENLIKSAMQDFRNGFFAAAKLIPGISEDGTARLLLSQMTREVIATDAVPNGCHKTALRIAMMIMAEFSAEFKTAVTKGDGTGLVNRIGAPLPDAYLSLNGTTKRNNKSAFGYHALKTDYVEMSPQLLECAKKLVDLGMKIDDRLMKIAISDQSLVLNDLEKRFVDHMRDDDRVQRWFRNPPSKPYSACYANVGGVNNLFYPDFLVHGKNGKKIAVETKYDESNIREKMRGGKRGDTEYGEVVFVKWNDQSKQLDEVLGFDENGPIVRALDFSHFF